MSTATRILLGVLGSFLILAIVLFVSYTNAHNAANQHEQGIKAVYKQSESVLGQYGQKIKEMAQVPGMQAEDLTNIITAANESRYGNGGSEGVMTWITEQNPTLDQSTYLQLQREISAGRDEFKNSQALLLDRVRAYEVDLGSFYTSKFMRLAGFPRIDLEQYDIVSTGAARGAFETKIDTDPIELR
jgi:hypothetical protein